MRKKALALALVLAAATATSAFAAGPLGLTGFGIYGSVGSTAGKLGGGTGLSLKWGSFPVVGLQYNFTASKVNASLDYYVIDAEGLGASVSYFLGAGVYAGAGADAFDFGLRITPGLQFWPIKKVEIYGAPVVSIPIIPTPSFALGAEFGLRIRF
ncbi:MAG: hypothetical protein JNG85_15855 [Spirochaetaceae bacterium]|nr:hypothetical protein [Spirochaetaceae bacterium]